MNALSRLANYIDFTERRIVMNSFVKFEFNYCPFIWMFRSR